MKTHYYNAFFKGRSQFFIESSSLTREEAIEEINDYPQLVYSYTLEVGIEETKRIDLESEAMDLKRDYKD